MPGNESVDVSEFVNAIRDEFLPGETITADSPLLSSGAIDSLNISALLAFLESRFGAQIDLMDIGYDNFDTPSQMLQMIENGRRAI
jgi:acyl carrier protein